MHPKATSPPTLIVLNPMRKLVLPMANFKRLAGVLLATSIVATSAAAQEPQKPTLTTEIGLSTVWNTGMNISPFGLKYQSEYFGLRPALHAQVLLQYKPGEAIGLEAQGLQWRKSLADLSAETRILQSYVGLAWAKVSPLHRQSLFLRNSLSVGVTYTQGLAQAWGSRAETKANAWGMGLTYRLTLGYRLSQSHAIGLQVGLSTYSSFNWRGIFSPDAYTGSILGKNTNVGVYPSVGLVFTNPLGR